MPGPVFAFSVKTKSRGFSQRGGCQQQETTTLEMEFEKLCSNAMDLFLEKARSIPLSSKLHTVPIKSVFLFYKIIIFFEHESV
jgi:hypothetical protein